MPSFPFNACPADIRWPVTRGDDPAMPWYFFDYFVTYGHPNNVPRDITADTFFSSVSTSRVDGVVITYPDPVIADGPGGLLLLKMTDIQTRLLTRSTYVWDLVFDPGGTTETTLAAGRMTVAGRATP